MGIPRQILQAIAVCVFIQLSYQQAGPNDEGFLYYPNAEYPKDCMEIKSQDTRASPESKLHSIKPDGATEPFEVYCDQTTDNGGWTVFQRRQNGNTDFACSLTNYKDGFGFLLGDHWLGNEKLAYLTNQKQYELRIELAKDGSTYVMYDYFRITHENYTMASLGTYSGNGADGMTGQVEADFSVGHNGCSGGWWYSSASCSSQPNLNGKYTSLNQNEKFHWTSGDELSFSEMKIRPAS